MHSPGAALAQRVAHLFHTPEHAALARLLASFPSATATDAQLASATRAPEAHVRRLMFDLAKSGAVRHIEQVGADGGTTVGANGRNVTRRWVRASAWALDPELLAHTVLRRAEWMRSRLRDTRPVADEWACAYSEHAPHDEPHRPIRVANAKGGRFRVVVAASTEESFDVDLRGLDRLATEAGGVRRLHGCTKHGSLVAAFLASVRRARPRWLSARTLRAHAGAPAFVCGGEKMRTDAAAAAHFKCSCGARLVRTDAGDGDTLALQLELRRTMSRIEHEAREILARVERPVEPEITYTILFGSPSPPSRAKRHSRVPWVRVYEPPTPPRAFAPPRVARFPRRREEWDVEYDQFVGFDSSEDEW